MSKVYKFTLRVEVDLLEKFRYIAKYNGRSLNNELNILMKKYIEKYEQRHGAIHYEV